ncbi:DUF389 domain-containing protein [Hymenobacter cellulosivorans]|uniref:DUF389 domain-containing protein n=1 Tax=Hymenobacter cellulosivorans TaxID=2932249 RepID=A0ABY4F5V3_9BACT|nr:DUF389 domain-containing protein [Hymenobacter cellulosivorans]UOQ51859.1 DUF389 domain-containing protein [Hymenobacter cellulosivorans]
MHRTLEITVPAAVTESLCQELTDLTEVIGLSVQLGASRKPAGDVLIVHVLNRGADEVLRRARAAVPDDKDLSVVTSEAASFISPSHHKTIVDDKDEAIWEEMESGLRHQGAITTNYLLLMALGGLICAVGLVSEPVPQAVAFISSAIIAPGFDPMTKVPVGLALRRWILVWRGIESALVGYAVLILTAALTMYVLVATGETSAAELAANPEVEHLLHPKWMELLVAAAGALAGVVMLAAFRRSFQAGPLIAMAFIPAAALIGAGLAVGRFDLALEGLQRFGADWGFIVALGVPFFWLKQKFLHQRRPIV